MDGNTSNGSTKLIRCKVSRQDGSTSTRYIEFEVFKFWQFMMIQKHGFEITDMSLCLWVDDADYKQKEEIYVRVGEVASVCKIVVSIYDSNNGFTHTSSRFVPEADVEIIREVLMSHIPDDVAKSEGFEINTYSGKSVERNKITRLDEIVIGLSCE